MKKLLKKTFRDFYPGRFNIKNIDVDSYLKMCDEERLLEKYGAQLDGSEKNILTLKTMPWLDLGDLPDSYD